MKSHICTLLEVPFIGGTPLPAVLGGLERVSSLNQSGTLFASLSEGSKVIVLRIYDAVPYAIMYSIRIYLLLVAAGLHCDIKNLVLVCMLILASFIAMPFSLC